MTKSFSPKGAFRKSRTAKSSSKRTRKNQTAPKVVAENVRGAYRATARKVSAEKVRDTWNATALLEQFPGIQVPTRFRALAEQNVAYTRELYEGSKNTLQAVLESWQKSFGAAGQGPRRLIVGSSTLLSATSIPASILRRGLLAREISARSWNCRQPIGASC